MLVVNYGKFQNASLTIGNIPLKAPDALHIPDPEKPAPAKSFRSVEKIHLDVKIETAKEPGDFPFISLDSPVKPKPEKPAPVRKTAARKAASKKFNSEKPLKLRVRVSSGAQKKSPAVPAAPKKAKSSRGGSAAVRKGK